MKKLLPIIGCILLLYGCEKLEVEQKKWFSYTNTSFDYFLEIPNKIYIPNKDQSKDQIFFGNIRIGGNDPDAINIKILANNVDTCTKQSMGISSPERTESSDDSLLWGKVDFWDDFFEPEGEFRKVKPICSPPIPFPRKEYFPCTDPSIEDWTSDHVPCSVQMRQYEIEHGMYAAYALCSEKDGKRVVVCVQQMTDNPKLAEEIFSTFRWTE